MSIDGYSVLFMFTLAVLVLIIFGIFVQRQIFRLRNNSVRRDPNVTVGAGFSKRKRNDLRNGVEATRQFQLLRAPKFTEIGTIGEHANAPYIHRMIALDEIREIERQLEFINADLVREAGDSTYTYLKRMREVALKSLSETTIERVGFLAEHCRFRHNAFGEKELSELRALIKEIMKILNDEQERLSALQLRHTDSCGSATISASLHGISKRLAAESKSHVRKRNKSDVVERGENVPRLAAGEEFIMKKYAGMQRRKEHVEHELPLLGTHEEELETRLDSLRPAAVTSRVLPSDSRKCLPSERSPLVVSSTN